MDDVTMQAIADINCLVARRKDDLMTTEKRVSTSLEKLRTLNAEMEKLTKDGLNRNDITSKEKDWFEKFFMDDALRDLAIEVQTNADLRLLVEKHIADLSKRRDREKRVIELLEEKFKDEFKNYESFKRRYPS